MFEKVLLFQKKEKRTKPMVLAVLLETAIITLLIFSPLFFEKNNIKNVVFTEQIFLPPRVPSGVGKSAEKKPGAKSIAKIPQQEKPPLQSPAEIPKDIVTENNTGEKNKTGGEETENTGGVPGGKPCDSPNCVVGGTGESKNKENESKPSSSEPKSPPQPDPPKPKVGGKIKQAVLIHKVDPIYPELARRNNVQGDVFLEATIGKDGNLHNIKVIKGHTLLRQSSVDAIKQWKYEPATLNGKPTEVATTITVIYILK